ncbi:MAG: universal stress protein [Nitrospirae bacterium]|nr:universal stress protein [Nitrospirota bacterium]
MGKYMKILVAVDGSEFSKSAFRQACRLARENGRTLTAVMAVPALEDQFEVLKHREKAEAVLKELSEKVMASIKAIGDEEGVKTAVNIVDGDAHSAISETAAEGRHDLVVMGRRGKTGIERALMGSVTARVIGHSSADVLVVQKNTALGWKKILVATDGSRHGDAAVDKAIDLAKAYGGELAVVSVVDVNEEIYAEAPEAVEGFVKTSLKAVAAVKEKAEKAGLKAESVVKEGEAYQAIVDAAKELNANLVVMGSHGRTGLKRLLMGSVTEKVIGHIPCPVLVVKS